MSQEKRVAVVVGVGPGLGGAVARRFARGGFTVALVARKLESSKPLEEAIKSAGGEARGFAIDATNPKSVEEGFASIKSALGSPDVLVYNAGAFVPGSVLDASPEAFESAWKGNCFGGFLVARACVPAMVERGHGTVIFTGATASLRGSANFSCLAVGKFGLRALSQSLAREVQPKGVHVAHVICDGPIDSPRVRGMIPGRGPETMLDPEAIAEAYWALHEQAKGAWTLELDVRSYAEKF